MVTRIRTWSTSAASNSQTPPNGAPEGATLVNQLTDILRQIMAEIRSWYEVAGWIDLGHTPTYTSATVFTVTGNQTGTYEVGRRIRAVNGVGSTIFGTITDAVFSSTTSVTVAWDSGSLDNTVAEVAIGAATVSNPWISFRSLAGSILRSQMPAEALFQTGMGLPFLGMVAPAGWILWFGTIGTATSGATNRANSDTQSLYSAIWNTFADAEAPVAGGRGANAASDFAANKPIALPDIRGRVIAALDNLGGAAANRVTSAISLISGSTVGGSGGDQRVQQHAHTVTDTGHSHDVNTTAVGVSAGGTPLPFPSGGSVTTNVVRSANTGITINNYGSGGAQNMQPTIMLPWIVKL